MQGIQSSLIYFCLPSTQNTQVKWLLFRHLCAKSLQSHPTLCDLWTVALQALLSVAFSRQEYQSALPCPPPGYLSDPGIEPASFTSFISPMLADEFFTTSITWEARHLHQRLNSTCSPVVLILSTPTKCVSSLQVSTSRLLSFLTCIFFNQSILAQFPLYNRVNQLYVYIHPLDFKELQPVNPKGNQS